MKCPQEYRIKDAGPGPVNLDRLVSASLTMQYQTLFEGNYGWGGDPGGCNSATDLIKAKTVVNIAAFSVKNFLQHSIDENNRMVLSRLCCNYCWGFKSFVKVRKDPKRWNTIRSPYDYKF